MKNTDEHIVIRFLWMRVEVKNPSLMTIVILGMMIALILLLKVL